MSTDEFFDSKPASDLANVRRLAERAVSLERAVETLEADLKIYKAELLTLRREKIPDAMSEHGLTEFKLEDGSGIKVRNYVSGTLPKTPIERLFALRLLEENGGEALITNDLTVSFQKKDHNRAIALADELKSAGYEPQIESTVHPSTLAAWCREKVREGAQIDFTALGVFVGRDVTINLPERTE
jgi:hypothetical protein